MTLSNNSNKNLVSIDGKSVQRIFYKGVPVVTLEMIATFHGRERKVADDNFSNNRDRLILGVDYYQAPYDTWKRILKPENFGDQDSLKRNIQKNNHGGYRSEMIFFTLTGYLMLVKSFTDDLAWKIQRELVNFYFDKHADMTPLLQAGATITLKIG